MIGWLLRRLSDQADPVIDELIRPPRYTFTGRDETLEARTQQRRALAEQMRRDALRLETRDDRGSRLRRMA